MESLSPSQGEERVRILLVDDRPGNLVSLSGILERPEYELLTASSGEEALRLALRSQIALVLLDVAMPRMDGFEVARLMKQRDRLKAIPIIFVTASVQKIDWVFNAYSVGAVDVLWKPLEPHAVRAKVAVFVDLFRQRRQLEQQAIALQEAERRERELAIAQLRLETERRYRNLAESIPHVVWRAGPEGDLRYFNRLWTDLTGLSEDVSLGDGWRAALEREDATALDDVWEDARRSGQPFAVECRLRRADGSQRWYLCRALPEVEGGEGVIGWLGTFTDVDEQRRAHEAMRETLRLRDEFLSVASHELRTPLTTLQLQLQSLQRLAMASKLSVDERVGRRLASAVRQTRRLGSLVDGLLDVSRITTGRLNLSLEELDLSLLVSEMVERYREEAERAGCELTLRVDGPVVGRWDRLRLEQSVTNLLSNSFRYAKGKPIEVQVGPGAEGARLSVRDHGIGIEPEDAARIFERFERAVPARHYGGLGLGLYIVRQIAEAHGGRVTVESKPSFGSTFTLELPLAPPASDERTRPEGGSPTERLH
ncbi:MAG: sensor histidine kinase [Deltaproteobacteria bacterium]